MALPGRARSCPEDLRARPGSAMLASRDLREAMHRADGAEWSRSWPCADLCQSGYGTTRCGAVQRGAVWCGAVWRRAARCSAA
eukprot:14768198-Alexandrium_andersonii.AAC.1